MRQLREGNLGDRLWASSPKNNSNQRDGPDRKGLGSGGGEVCSADRSQREFECPVGVREI